MIDVQVGPLTVGNDRPLTLISGPCQLESSDHAQMIAGQLAEACAAHGAQFVFKGSYDKANRTSLSGKRGLGMEAGLKVLDDVKRAIGCPVLTDIHHPEEAGQVAEVADVLQIPAFMCRQTSLLEAAGARLSPGWMRAFLDDPQGTAPGDKLITTVLATESAQDFERWTSAVERAGSRGAPKP